MDDEINKKHLNGSNKETSQSLKKTTNDEQQAIDTANSEFENRLKKLQEEKLELDVLLQEEKNKQNSRRKQNLQNTFISVLFISIGMTIFFIGESNIDPSEFFYRNKVTILGLIFTSVGIIYYATKNLTSTAEFRDVDIRRRLENVKKVSGPAAAWPFPTGNIKDDPNSEFEEYSPVIVDNTSEINVKKLKEDLFCNYFMGLTEVLESRAFDAEEKASLLLDKGTTYTLGGIVFFIFSIVAWQAAAWIHGFKQEFIYGIISCSTLFIFIEFLSAWFLKQYRHYVDTSTYLIKVKAIFDRYILVYLASISHPTISQEEQKRVDMLMEMLSQDIKWPESYLLKKADTSFALEATNAINLLTKEIRKKNRKAKADSDTKPETK